MTAVKKVLFVSKDPEGTIDPYDLDDLVFVRPEINRNYASRLQEVSDACETDAELVALVAYQSTPLEKTDIDAFAYLEQVCRQNSLTFILYLGLHAGRESVKLRGSFNVDIVWSVDKFSPESLYELLVEELQSTVPVTNDKATIPVEHLTCVELLRSHLNSLRETLIKREQHVFFWGRPKTGKHRILKSIFREDGFNKVDYVDLSKEISADWQLFAYNRSDDVVYYLKSLGRISESNRKSLVAHLRDHPEDKFIFVDYYSPDVLEEKSLISHELWRIITPAVFHLWPLKERLRACEEELDHVLNIIKREGKFGSIPRKRVLKFVTKAREKIVEHRWLNNFDDLIEAVKKMLRQVEENYGNIATADYNKPIVLEEHLIPPSVTKELPYVTVLLNYYSDAQGDNKKHFEAIRSHLAGYIRRGNMVRLINGQDVEIGQSIQDQNRRSVAEADIIVPFMCLDASTDNIIKNLYLNIDTNKKTLVTVAVQRLNWDEIDVIKGTSVLSDYRIYPLGAKTDRKRTLKDCSKKDRNDLYLEIADVIKKAVAEKQKELDLFAPTS